MVMVQQPRQRPRRPPVESRPIPKRLEGPGVLIRTLPPLAKTTICAAAMPGEEMEEGCSYKSLPAAAAAAASKRNGCRPQNGSVCLIHYTSYILLDDDDDDDDDDTDDDEMNNESNRNTLHNNNNHHPVRSSATGSSRRIRPATTNTTTNNTSSNMLFLDSTYQREMPLRLTIGASHVVDGLDAALQRMVVGQRAEITIPSLYAYGGTSNRRRRTTTTTTNNNNNNNNNASSEADYLEGCPPNIPPGATLVYLVEMLDILQHDHH